MDSKNVLQSIFKYAVPVIFAAIAVFLVIKGSEVNTFENATCGTDATYTSGEVTEAPEDPETIHTDLTITQTQAFRYAGFTFLVMSIVMGLFISGVISRRISLILMPIFAAVAGIMIFLSYTSIAEIAEADARKDKMYKETKQRMIDFKEAAVAFKSENNRYPETADELVDFVKNGSVYTIKADDRDVPDRPITEPEAFMIWGEGTDTEKRALIGEDGDSTKFNAEMRKWLRTTTIPWGDSSLNEQMAVRLNLIARDTVRIPVKEKLFTGPNAKARYSDFPFAADSLKYVAFAGGGENAEFIYRWKKIKNISEDSVVTYKYRFELRMPTPLKVQYSDNDCEPKDELIMGSLDADKLTGNW